MLLVRRCPLCDRILDRSCWHPDLRRICQRCHTRLSPGPPTTIAGIDHVSAVWTYDEDSGPLVRAAKQLGGRQLMACLAGELALHLRPFLMQSTVITWAPPSPAGKRRRGFDQGRVLAERTAALVGVTAAPAFSRAGRAQFGGNRQVRLDGPRLRLRPDWTLRARTDQVVVVDDVITTGSTLATASDAIRSHQPSVDIVAMALAVRP